MAPLNPNLTDRLYVDYVTGNRPTSQEHTALVRFDGDSWDPSAPQEAFLAILNAFGAGNFGNGWKVVRCRVGRRNEAFTLPTTVIPDLLAFEGNLGTGYNARMEAVECTFQGRSTASGRRVDVSLYRGCVDSPDNFRVLGGQGGVNGLINTAVAAMNVASQAGQGFWALDATPARWYNYLNFNYNSYWERRLRSV